MNKKKSMTFTNSKYQQAPIAKNIIVVGCILLLLLSCTRSSNRFISTELITDSKSQDSIFNTLIDLTGEINGNLNDSLAFLIIPLQATCPSCRNKTIDSIVKHENSLAKNHYIIISVNGGKKTIQGFFFENDAKLPILDDRLLLDTINRAHRLKLYDGKPTMYYSHRKKVYKKVASIPQTIKDDLKEFFSGS